MFILKIKNKLISSLGSIGYILFFVISIVLIFYPCFFILRLNSWLTFLILLAYQLIPFVEIPFWIWGFIVCVTGRQDIFTVIFYILFVIFYIIPYTVNLFTIFKKKV